MRLHVSMLALPLVFLFSVVASVAAATPQTFLTLISQPGDYVGQGITQTFTAADGTFAVSNTAYTASITFYNADYSQSWTLDFGAPSIVSTVKFGRGEFDNAQRTPFRSPTRTGIDVGGDGRGCNTDAGRFMVSDFALNTDGTIARLAIDFEQHCEGATPALYGSVRYNSYVAAVPRLGIASTYALKGNAGTSDASITVSLCSPSTSVVQVAYTTADVSAIQGTDYLATSGVVTFPPGVTAQAIIVPVIGNVAASGNKIFHVKLSAPSGAPIEFGSANILIRDPNVPQTVLAMASLTGDYIGQGEQYLFTLSDGSFTFTNSANVVTFTIDDGDFWDVDLAGPTSARLGKGDYENAQGYPFQLGTPGLSVDGAGRGCDTVTGNFQVLQAGYNSSNVLQNFSANFTQSCEGTEPDLFGYLRYHSVLQQVSVTDAVIEGSSAIFTVTLNPPSTNYVSVDFDTIDGTALAGTDYVFTGLAINFAPGIVQQTVTVPLLTPGGVSKTFYGKLFTPFHAPIWVGQGSATF